MKLLDTVMDALNSFFPDLIRTPAPGGASGRGAPEGAEEGAGFAASLVQFLGGRAASEKAADSREPGEGTPLGMESAAEGSGEADSMGLGSGVRADGVREDGAGGGGVWTDGARLHGSGAGFQRVMLPSHGERLTDTGILGGGLMGSRETSTAEASRSPDPSSVGSQLQGTSGPAPGIPMDVTDDPQGSEPNSGAEKNPDRPILLEPTHFGSTEAVGTSGSEADLEAGTDNGRLGAEGADEVADVGNSTGKNPATSALASSAGRMDRDMGRLDPELQTRLERVINRMESEFGHEVRLVEGYRSPERQAELFQQGRTRPGAKVTWTQESQHSSGRAADVQVDGSWNNPQAYARLQEIAREEGLQTLGAKDAGHLQLPEETAEGSRAPLTSEDGWNRSQGGLSRPARIARVAAPSRTARVARVASPAHPGGNRAAESTPASVTVEAIDSSARDSSGPRVSEAASGVQQTEVLAQSDRRAEAASKAPGAPAEQTDLPAASLMSTSGNRAGEGRTGGGGRHKAQRASGVDDPSRGEGVLGQGWNQRAGASTPELQGAEGVQRIGSMERVNEIQALTDAQNARLPGRIHLDLLDADGVGTRLRLSLRGNQLGGTVDLTDPAATLRMKDRVGELHQALARQGLDANALGIQAARGAEAGRGIEVDLAALLQDPLAGLSRILESRDGSLDARHQRQGTPGDEAQKEQGRFKDPARRDRKKEETP